MRCLYQLLSNFGEELSERNVTAVFVALFQLTRFI